MDYVRQLKLEEQPKGFVAVLTALQNDIGSSWLKAEVKRVALSYGEVGDDTDWDQTLVSVRDLKEWLKERGVSTGFFYPEGPVSANYLNPGDPNFSSKLAAAVEAWKAVKADRNRKPSSKSVKADLTKWLNIHASEYGLTNEAGEPNKLAIEEVSKVANWDQRGGAPKTPNAKPAAEVQRG